MVLEIDYQAVEKLSRKSNTLYNKNDSITLTMIMKMIIVLIMTVMSDHKKNAMT